MSMLSPGVAIAAPARRRAALSPATWAGFTPRTTSRQRTLHHDSQSSTSSHYPSQHSTSNSSNSNTASTSAPRALPSRPHDLPSFASQHRASEPVPPSSSYPASSSSARRVHHPIPRPEPASSSAQHETSASTSRALPKEAPSPARTPLRAMRHSRSVVKDRAPAYKATMLVEETRDVVDTFVTGRLSAERLSPTRAVAELVELLPQCSPCQATLLLISSLTTEDRATSENLAFARALYQLQAAEYASSPDAVVPTATKYLARVVRPSFVDVGSSVAYAALAAEVAQDRRLKASERRSLLVRAMPSLCRLLRELSSTGRGRHTREIRGRHLFDVWRHALEALLHEGVLSPAQQKKESAAREKSHAASLCAQMLMMAVRWGASSSAVKLAEALTASRSLEHVAVSQTVHSANMSAHERPSRAIADELIQGLIFRGAERHAGKLFMLLPRQARSLNCYAALLEHFGEAETTKVWYPRSLQPGEPAPPPPTPPSMAFQRQLWEDALARVRQADQAEHAHLLRRLFGARMVSHARHANVELVESDLRAMESVGLLGDGSALSDKAQVAIVQAYVRAGQWEEAKSRAVEMLAQRRQSGIDAADVASHGSALLNTLIAGVVAQDAHVTSADQEQRSASLDEGQEEDEAEEQEVSNERGLLDQVLSEVSLPIGTLVQVLRCHDDLVAEMDVKPNAVTRNILLGFLFRWRLAPLGDDISTIRQLLKRCGVFGSKRGAAAAKGNNDAAVVEEAKEFLRHGKSVLRAVVSTLYEQGHVEHAQWVLGMLKEGELAAQVELRGAAQRARVTRAAGDKEAGKGAAEA